MNRMIKTASVAVALAASAFILSPVARACTGGTNGTTGILPSSVQMKILQVMISTNANCSHPINVDMPANPTYLDFTKSPTLLSGAVPPGTYNCIMIEMSSLVNLTPATSSTDIDSACVAGTQYMNDTCSRVGQTFVIPTTGATATCNGTSQQDGVNTNKWMYIAVGGTNTAQSPPGGGGSPALAWPLSGPLKVTGNTTATFNAQFTISSYANSCTGGKYVCELGSVQFSAQ